MYILNVFHATINKFVSHVQLQVIKNMKQNMSITQRKKYEMQVGQIKLYYSKRK